MTPPLTDAELDALETEAKRLVALLDVRWKGDLRWWADVEARIKAISKYATVKDLWNAVREKQAEDTQCDAHSNISRCHLPAHHEGAHQFYSWRDL